MDERDDLIQKTLVDEENEKKGYPPDNEEEDPWDEGYDAGYKDGVEENEECCSNLAIGVDSSFKRGYDEGYDDAKKEFQGTEYEDVSTQFTLTLDNEGDHFTVTKTILEDCICWNDIVAALKGILITNGYSFTKKANRLWNRLIDYSFEEGDDD